MSEFAAILARLRLPPIESGSLQPLRGDGSDRRFHRLLLADGRRLVAVLPADREPRSLAEARSAYLIGAHLAAKGAPVPAIHGYDEETGALFFEDWGDQHLVSWVAVHRAQPGLVAGLYRRIVAALGAMQVRGVVGWRTDWAFDTHSYDRRVMLERESGYFAEAFVKGYAGIATLPAGLREEFIQLADRCSVLDNRFFLHRDFQSRNILVRGEAFCFIDFQAGRLGPLGYDLASLLRDPYTELPQRMQDELFAHYCQVVSRKIPLEPTAFAEGYWSLALQRNLQILGAFSFLSASKGKPFFHRYIPIAFASLQTLLATPMGNDYPVLTALARRIGERLEQPPTLA